MHGGEGLFSERGEWGKALLRRSGLSLSLRARNENSGKSLSFTLQGSPGPGVSVPLKSVRPIKPSAIRISCLPRDSTVYLSGAKGFGLVSREVIY